LGNGVKSDTLLTRVAKQGKKESIGHKFKNQLLFIIKHHPLLQTSKHTWKRMEKALGNEIKQHTEKKNA
jgi:hypothetical protein